MPLLAPSSVSQPSSHYNIHLGCHDSHHPCAAINENLRALISPSLSRLSYFHHATQDRWKITSAFSSVLPNTLAWAPYTAEREPILTSLNPSTTRQPSRPRFPWAFSRKALEAELKMTPLSLMVHRKFGNWRRISSPSPAGKPLSYPRPNPGKCVSLSLRDAPRRLSTKEERNCTYLLKLLPDLRQLRVIFRRRESKGCWNITKNCGKNARFVWATHRGLNFIYFKLKKDAPANFEIIREMVPGSEKYSSICNVNRMHY